MTIVSNKIHELDQFYIDKIEKYQEETEIKLAKLKESQKKKFDELNEKWKNQKPPQYRKPSAQLLQLKTIERNLAKTGDYKRAEILYKETETLTKREMEDPQSRLTSDYKSNKMRLKQKQKKEIEQFQQSRHDGLILIQNEHKLKRKQYENRNKILEQQKGLVAARRFNQESQSLSLPAPITSDQQKKTQYNLLPELVAPNDPEL